MKSQNFYTNDNTNLKQKLTPLQYKVTQEKGTEPSYEGEYYEHFEPGIYHCIVCNERLFE